MKVCQQCGFKNNDDTKFCVNCGNNIENAVSNESKISVFSSSLYAPATSTLSKDFENVVFRFFGGTSVSHKNGDAFSYLSRAGYYTSPMQARECAAEVEVLELYETEHTYRMQFILTAGAHSSDVYTAVFVKRDDGSCYWKALR